MRNLVIGALVAGMTLGTSAPSSAMKSMAMTSKCKAGDAMVMVDPKTKMYHVLSDKKSHMMMEKTGDKTVMMCKSKAAGMGAKMMMNGKAGM
ncbi:MAG: hypothetical protein NVSMB21_19670 [Vulcanimicrobiaceae bacterium]